MVRNLPAVQETRVQSLGREEPLEKEMETHSSILTWKNPMDRGAWLAAVHGVTKGRTRLSDFFQCSCLETSMDRGAGRAGLQHKIGLSFALQPSEDHVLSGPGRVLILPPVPALIQQHLLRPLPPLPLGDLQAIPHF